MATDPDLAKRAIDAGIDPRGRSDEDLREDLETSSAAGAQAAAPQLDVGDDSDLVIASPATAAELDGDDDDATPPKAEPKPERASDEQAHEHALDAAVAKPTLQGLDGGGEGATGDQGGDDPPPHVKLRRSLDQMIDDLYSRAGEIPMVEDGGALAGAIAQLYPAVLMAESHAERAAVAPSAAMAEAIGHLGRLAQMLADVREIEARPVHVASGDGFETPTGPPQAYRVLPEGFEDLDPIALQRTASKLHAARVGQEGGR